MEGSAEGSISRDGVDKNWSCKVCGKKNGKTQRLCLTCGRPKGYVGNKKIQVLNSNRIDITPHLNCATKDELKKATTIQRCQLQWDTKEIKTTTKQMQG